MALKNTPGVVFGPLESLHAATTSSLQEMLCLHVADDPLGGESCHQRWGDVALDEQPGRDKPPTAIAPQVHFGVRGGTAPTMTESYPDLA